MKLLNLSKNLIYSLVLLFSTSLFSEESIEIWKKKNPNSQNNVVETKDNIPNRTQSKINFSLDQSNEIKINSSNLENSKSLIYGIFDPEENNLTIDMWINSEGTRVKDTIERINKIKLSSFAEEVFVNTLFTISKLPSQNMTDEQFINYKLDYKSYIL